MKVNLAAQVNLHNKLFKFSSKTKPVILDLQGTYFIIRLFYPKSLLHDYSNDMFCKLVDNMRFIYALKSTNKTSNILFGTTT